MKGLADYETISAVSDDRPIARGSFAWYPRRPGPPAEQQVVEPRPPVPVEGHDLAVEHESRGQGVEQRFEPPQPVAVLREHAAPGSCRRAPGSCRAAARTATHRRRTAPCGGWR